MTLGPRLKAKNVDLGLDLTPSLLSLNLLTLTLKLLNLTLALYLLVLLTSVDWLGQ